MIVIFIAFWDFKHFLRNAMSEMAYAMLRYKSKTESEDPEKICLFHSEP